MKERGTFLVPTMYIGGYFLEEHPESEAQKKSNELSLKYREDFFRNIGAAIRAGVKVAVGVDLGHYGHDPKVYTREFGTLVEAGMSPMEAIQAGTRVGSELLGWDDRIGRNGRIGTLEPGKLADIIAVDGDPLDDITALENVRFIMLGGRVIRGAREPD